MTLSEINKLVYDRYPVKEKEKTCLSFHDKREGIRSAYRRRLINDNRINHIKQAAKNQS